MRKRVSIRGTYIKGHDVLLGLRSAPLSNGRQAAQGMVVNPQGYFVYSPFQMSADGKEAAGPIVYVNRGWVGHRQEKWGVQEGPVELECVVVGGEKSSVFSPPHDLSSKKLLWLDTAALLEASGIGSVYERSRDEMRASGVVVMDLVATLDGDVGGKLKDKAEEAAAEVLPIPKEPYNALTDYYVTPATHAAYAFTWYSLAICSLAVSYFKFRKPTAGAAQLRRMKNSAQGDKDSS